MGFNNDGVDALVANVKRATFTSGILGINIGKNSDTPIEKAADDYLIGLRQGVCARQLRRRQHLLARTPKTCASCRATTNSTRCSAQLKAEQAQLAQRTANTCRWR